MFNVFPFFKKKYWHKYNTHAIIITYIDRIYLDLYILSFIYAITLLEQYVILIIIYK